MQNDSGISASIADNPLILWALLFAGVLGIILGALNKGTTTVGAWLSSLRRIGADAKAADIAARDLQIQNLSKDLLSERDARQKDRKYFQNEISRRDKLSRDHVIWDWQVYTVLVKAGLWDKENDGPPPPLF